VRLNTGQWGAIVGNGYNSASGKAVLYIIDIKTGTLIKALSAGAGNATSPNGLSSPSAVDTNFDGKADYV
jgi:type IV pilus assembly protein PilY1